MDRSDAILERLTALHPRKIDLSLGRIEVLLDKLGAPQRRLPPVIHVAGTNGKGSTIAFMRAILEAAGRSVHVYTSPHLVRFHERIRLAGRLVAEDRLAATLAECEEVNAGAAITHFEIVTAAAFKLFSETPADFLLLEVGLGGRYDATNVIDRPAASVITPVSIDHVEFLGPAIEGIALEKAGIIKRDVPAIVSGQSAAARAVIEREAEKIRAPIFIGGQDFGARVEHGRMVFEDRAGLLDLPTPRLAGRHQIQNAGTAIATLRVVAPDLPDAAYERGVESVEWPGRLQRLTKGHLVDLAPVEAEIWLDGGHNAAGGEALGEAMADFEERSPRPLALIAGMLTTKDAAAFLAAFSGLALEILAVPVNGDHAGRAPADLTEIARHGGFHADAMESVEQALAYLAERRWATPPRILIAGSLYLAGETLARNGTPPT